MIENFEEFVAKVNHFLNLFVELNQVVIFFFHLLFFPELYLQVFLIHQVISTKKQKFIKLNLKKNSFIQFTGRCLYKRRIAIII
jgi:hypothetical protein